MGQASTGDDGMINGPLLHPPLLHALAAAGHGAKILVADALYPHSTGAPATASRVYLNLCEGMVPAQAVMDAVSQSVAVEAITFMATAEGKASETVVDCQQRLAGHRHGNGQTIAWSGLERWAFYDACRAPDVCLLIATGERRPYSNFLLTIGVP
ncbi:RbsD or FucU transport [Chromohalobacter salexigens]|nr:RbsD or FucU transport [Chromohalobacter salexigens]